MDFNKADNFAPNSNLFLKFSNSVFNVCIRTDEIKNNLNMQHIFSISTYHFSVAYKITGNLYHLVSHPTLSVQFEIRLQRYAWRKVK